MTKHLDFCYFSFFLKESKMSLVRVGSSLGVGLVLTVAFSGRALAQAAKAPAAPAASVPAAAPSAPAAAPSAPINVNAPDIVRLKNGGILRGTISELVPGDYVSLVLITGEQRKVPYADVQYAGPANAAPNPVAAPAVPAPAAPAPAVAAAAGAMPAASNPANEPQPFAVVHAKETRVNVVSKPNGLTLFRRSVSAGIGGVGTVNAYDEVCTAPCNVSMPAGTHTFAIARAGGKPHETDPVTLPAGNANMTITYVDRTFIRIGLGLLGFAGLISSVAIVASDSGSDKVALPIVLGGAGAGLVGVAFALSDGAKVAVAAGTGDPANNPANGSNRWLDQRPRDANALRNGMSGLTLTVHF
ncbi:MAG TPA: hypothetical protein VFK05_31660 [Polyangiaceae bacterium]|nr:hypothetical protein [Polyangiaceae bacterium]